jgi:predicted RNase H-like nuclease (RuvC/YqgF family)
VSEYEHNEHLLDEIQRLRESNFHLRKDCEEQKQRIKRLEDALNGTVKWIVDLANSGDAGFWNPEEQSVIIAARAALNKESKP